MYAAHHEDGLEILGVAFVEGGDRGRKWLTAYLAEKRVGWPNVMAGPEWYGPPMEGYDVSFLPFNVLLDRDGRVAGVELRGDALERAVAKVLEPPASAPSLGAR